MPNSPRKYKSPPIQEIICEFRFERARVDLNKIIELKDADFFQQYPKLQETVQLQFKSKQENHIMLQIEQPYRIVQFKDEDNQALIQIANGLLTFNHNGPYDGWETLKPTLLALFEDYSKIVQPQGLTQITLRYLDQIDISDNKANINDYVKIVPWVGSPDQPLTYFATTYELPGMQEQEMLRIEVQQLKPEAEDIDLSVQMDFHYFIDCKGQHLSIGDALERAHDSICDYFEKSIGDKARELFGEEA